MSRDLPSAMVSALDDAVIEPFFAVELETDTNPIRMWTGYDTLTIGSKDYLGLGTLLSISTVDETSETDVRGATIGISGISNSAISLALQEPYQGRVCKIYFGIGSETTEIFSGYMDQMNIQEGPETSLIQIKVENKLVDLERSRVARFTSSYQRSRDIADVESDKGLDFVASMQDKKVPWGREADA
tara:strand:- start:4426 stop:4986 length:561 start_codon:yes stop_codon:yes gene_type:complete